jgi:signal transduction histidine kinase
VGIEAREMEFLFEEFMQGSKEEMRKPRTHGGTGLGLNISAKQVCFFVG